MIELLQWLPYILFIFIMGYTWTPVEDGTNFPCDEHINDLQNKKLDDDGEISCKGTMMWKKGADIPSAETLEPGKDGNYFDVTGTTTITAIQATQSQPGTVIKLHFDGILTLTHHATNLILPGGANITTATGDEAEFLEYDTNKWRCTCYTKADGTAIVPSLALQVKIGLFTRDVSLATGTQEIAGVGFQPKEVEFKMSIASYGDPASWGHDDGTVHHCLYYGNIGGGFRFGQDNTISIYWRPDNEGNQYKGLIQSMNADGFTISWTKENLPTGTITVIYRAIG